MTVRTVPDVRSRIQHLLASVTVTSLETGKPLEGMAKRGRVIADVRGYQHKLVAVDYGTTSRAEFLALFDQMRQEQAE